MSMKLFKGDCLNILPLLEDNSFNIAITSPPYNMNLRIRNGKYCSRQVVKEFSTKYNNFSDNLSIQDYFEFNKKVISELIRACGLVFYNVQIVTGNKPAIFKLLGFFSDYIKELIVWDKVNAQPAMQQNVMNSQFELIIVLEKSSPESRMFKSSQFDRGTLSNLWNIKRGGKRVKGHGAVFPETLVEKILFNFTMEGDSVIDPFMGTGTTGVSCMKMNRLFTGIEIDQDYYEYASSRLELK